MDNKTAPTQGTVYTEIPLEYYIVAIGIIGATNEYSDFHRIEPMLPSWDIFQHVMDTLIRAGVFDEDTIPDFDSLEDAIEKLKKYLEAHPDKRKWPVSK